MTKPLTPYEVERLSYFLKGDKHALLLCLDLIFTGHLWDDLIDRDQERSNDDINQAFMKAFRGIPDNPFFKRWQPYLQPILIATAQAYVDSTKLEMGDPDDRLMAFILRNQSTIFISHCIYIAGLANEDPDWINQVSEEFWKLFKLKDKLVDFIMNEGPEYDLAENE